MTTAALAWLDQALEDVVRQASELGLPVDLSYTMTFAEGGKFLLTVRSEYWRRPSLEEDERCEP
jgi:hypothetical protein